MSTFRAVNPVVPVPSDIDIAHSVPPQPIRNIAAAVGVLEEELEPYGHYKAKVNLSILDRLKNVENGNYIVVTGMNPTSFGEGSFCPYPNPPFVLFSQFESGSDCYLFVTNSFVTLFLIVN